MNERLKELYEQAHMIREYSADDPMRGGNPSTVYWDGERSAKKFAELIVRECAEVADNADATREKWQSIGKFVREHFGVEK